MELSEILANVGKLYNAARSNCNAGDTQDALLSLVDLRDFLNENLPEAPVTSEPEPGASET